MKATASPTPWFGVSTVCAPVRSTGRTSVLWTPGRWGDSEVMHLTPEEIRALAQELFGAETSGKPIEPISTRYPQADVEDAYAIQVEGVRLRVSPADPVRGHKVGLTARVMQEQFGVRTPDFGQLRATMFHPEGQPLSTADLIAPRVEPEISFVLRRPLAGPGVTVADVLAATDFVVPSLEIIDSRIADWKIGIVDTIADNASSALVVVGGSRTQLSDIDPRLIGVTLRSNGEVVETGASAAVLGNPATAVAWLANTLAVHGQNLKEGDLIMPGSCTRAVALVPGQTVRADFDVLGHVSVSFTEAPDPKAEAA
jgi:2-keto-4-pentenoate hydratase